LTHSVTHKGIHTRIRKQTPLVAATDAGGAALNTYTERRRGGAAANAAARRAALLYRAANAAARRQDAGDETRQRVTKICSLDTKRR